MGGLCNIPSVKKRSCPKTILIPTREKTEPRGNILSLFYFDVTLLGLKLSSMNPTEARHQTATRIHQEEMTDKETGRWRKEVGTKKEKRCNPKGTVG